MLLAIFQSDLQLAQFILDKLSISIRPEHIRIICQETDSQNILKEPGELWVEVKAVEPLGRKY
ncbi:hypothetical protein U9R62_06885 [Cylindrospermopsis raciborskii DSH]|uniref:hypothetical protein n=1 Tax=Cylindrospermopsis raciborskii TaxID=77022 RepID=UPI002ED9CF2F